MNKEMFTIGHSNLKFDEYLLILLKNVVEKVFDVRSMPHSSKFPQFNISNLKKELPEYGIDYEHVPELGGFRPKSKTFNPQVNEGWTHPAFHNYADYAYESDSFSYGLQKVMDENKLSVIMCSESVWWKCHRRIITDYLIMNGIEVIHIIGNKIEHANITDFAVPQKSISKIIYPIESKQLFINF